MGEMEHKMILLHGALGTPADWKNSSELKTLSRDALCLDLYGAEAPKKFTDSLGVFAGQILGQMGSQKKFLIGYSFGGRLAWHLLISGPEKFRGAVIVGGHPGLVTSSERTARQTADAVWAQRLRQVDSPKNWEEFLESWNNQGVLRGTGAPLAARELPVASRLRVMADSLEFRGLGSQEDLRPQIAQLKVPVLYLSGESDLVYCRLGQELSRLNPRIRAEVIAGAGHRVPWDKPSEFSEWIYRFSEDLR